MICEKCGKEHDGTFGSGRFCSRACANSRIHSAETKLKIHNSLKGVSPSNKGCKKLKTETAYYKNFIIARNGDTLNITGEELEKYKASVKCCEICGRTIEETVKYESKFKPKSLCVDHNHETKQFRGLLCQLCNRQLGWYEKYSSEIHKYLTKHIKD